MEYEYTLRKIQADLNKTAKIQGKPKSDAEVKFTCPYCGSQNYEVIGSASKDRDREEPKYDTD